MEGHQGSAENQAEWIIHLTGFLYKRELDDEIYDFYLFSVKKKR